MLLGTRLIVVLRFCRDLFFLSLGASVKEFLLFGP